MSGDKKDTGVKKDSDSYIEYDERIDFYSDKFDPMFALSCKNIVIPKINAKTYDNLSAYQRAQQKQTSSGEQAQKKKPKSLTESNTPEAGTSGRRFLPHQMPVPSKQRKQKSTLFSRMQTIEGPLKLLRKCVEEKLRIKVWTRNAHTVRGYCIAYVNAFDKHWNLALSDITEVWTRPAKRKTVALDTDAGSYYRPFKKVQPPPITILKATKKEELCSRKVDQYILRGEHVVLIAVHDK